MATYYITVYVGLESTSSGAFQGTYEDAIVIAQGMIRMESRPASAKIRDDESGHITLVNSTGIVE